MRTTLRIVAGSLRGRKVTCNVHPDLRPTPQMVREALFSILGNAVPGRVFVDLFGGTGVVGLEAVSRGAKQSIIVERDFRQAQEIEQHIRAFGIYGQTKLYRTDVYRWIASWHPPKEPVNVFISPPFPDLQERPEQMLEALATLRERVADESVLILQSERDAAIEESPDLANWEYRTYGRNVLMLWQKGVNDVEVETSEEGGAASEE